MDGVQATQQSPSSSTAAYPPWVMFEPDADLDTTGSYSTADPNTLVLARTSSDHPIGVSLRLALPPAESRVCVHFPQGSQPSRFDNQVIAAHGDSVLIRVSREGGYDKPKDYFVYNAGTAATDSPRPPSLSLLPPGYYLHKDSTGILRRGEDDLVVARLEIEEQRNDDNTPKKHVAEVLLFRSGEWWKIRWARIGGIENDELDRYFWRSSGVIPVGDNMLCWVYLGSGLIFFTVDDKKLVYVPLPKDPRSAHSNRNVCVTSAGNAVKFVNMFDRCCCGGNGASECKHSKNCYVIKTWTLRMDSMTWVLDGMMDSTELWALDAYKSLPRVPPRFPVVSMDEPHVICFMVHEKEWWLIMLDMRCKMLRSVYSYPKGHEFENVYAGKHLLPSKVSYYLNNPYPGGPSSSQIVDDIEPPPLGILDKQQASNSKHLQSGSAEPGLHEILSALQEISRYGLTGDDTKKAISILTHGNGHRFISYLGVPMNLRKDWLLTEMNASVGRCSFCNIQPC